MASAILAAKYFAEANVIQILSWNIQCGLGIDGRTDLERIASVIKKMADFEVICLQKYQI